MSVEVFYFFFKQKTAYEMRTRVWSSDVCSSALQSLGWSSGLWSVVYAATGTINTSDEREKKWRGAANKKEIVAAKEMISELGFFQWIEAVDEKGPRRARYHYGVRAQRVWAIMAKHGRIGRAWCRERVCQYV